MFLHMLHNFVGEDENEYFHMQNVQFSSFYVKHAQSPSLHNIIPLLCLKRTRQKYILDPTSNFTSHSFSFLIILHKTNKQIKQKQSKQKKTSHYSFFHINKRQNI